MRHIWLTLIVGLISALAISTGYAASVGNPCVTNGAGQLSLELEYDAILEREMQEDNYLYQEIDPLGLVIYQSGRTPFESVEDVKFESNRVLAKISYGIADNLDLFVKLGLADFDAEAKLYSMGMYYQKAELEGDWDFAWAVGAQGVIYETSDGIKLGGSIQYLRHDCDIDMVYITDAFSGVRRSIVDWNSIPGIINASYAGEADIEEWQIALAISQEFDNFVPYFGVKYSDLKVETDNRVRQFDAIIGEPLGGFNEKWDFSADNNFGIFLGTDYKVAENFAVNIEARFIDETAVKVSGKYTF